MPSSATPSTMPPSSMASDCARLRGIATKHLDMDDLEEQLKAAGAAVKVIATDSAFSMDGNVAPLEKICVLADNYKALVMVDECCATGFFGPKNEVPEHFEHFCAPIRPAWIFASSEVTATIVVSKDVTFVESNTVPIDDSPNIIVYPGDNDDDSDNNDDDDVLGGSKMLNSFSFEPHDFFDGDGGPSQQLFSFNLSGSAPDDSFSEPQLTQSMSPESEEEEEEDENDDVDQHQHPLTRKHSLLALLLP
ncbi:2-amino-3-ketobutyrate coenzyme A ligase [Balamuthia mandrillaris]